MFVKKETENPLVVSLSLLLPILLLTGSNNLLNSALICHNLHFQSISQYPRKPLQNRAFRGKTRRTKTMIKILFICHGNICRSPMSEFVLKDMVEQRGLTEQFEIASAATSTEEIWNGKGNPIYPPAQAELKKHGIGKTAYTNFAGKRARQVTKEDYHHYDYLLCADTNNIRNTERITGADTEGKIHLLLDYADELQEDSQLQTKNKSSNSISRTISRRGKSIADPWYSGDFTQTWNDVVAGCTGFLNYLKNVHKI